MRIRINFHKTEAMRYTGHLDLFRTWERTIRRARLPLAYTQGFHPQPRIQLACALPLGFTSACEVADIWLETPITLQEIHQALEVARPPGIMITEINEVDVHQPALQTRITDSVYQITLLDESLNLAENVSALLAASTLPRERRGKNYDLRPLIVDIQMLPENEAGQKGLVARLKAQEGATGRPEEVVSALGYNPQSARYHRQFLYFS
jgi:radical SAM-linked protein